MSTDPEPTHTTATGDDEYDRDFIEHGARWQEYATELEAELDRLRTERDNHAGENERLRVQASNYAHDRDEARRERDEAHRRLEHEQARADQWQDHCKQGIAELAALRAELSRIVTLSEQCYVSRLDLTDMIRQALAGQATQPAEDQP